MIAALSQLIPLIKGHSPCFRQRVITGTNGKWRGGGGLRRREWGLFWQLKDWRQEEREALVAGSCWKRVKPLSICDSFSADAGNHFLLFFLPPKIVFCFFVTCITHWHNWDSLSISSLLLLCLLCHFYHIFERTSQPLTIAKNTGVTRTRDDMQ